MDRPGIKNWHWKQREVGGWAKAWFEEQLPQVSTPKTRIARVKEIEEDCCTVGMRKSKLITVYDLKIHSTWEGALADGTTVSGTITAVEVSHDMDEDDYVFETIFEDPSKYDGDKDAQALREDAHKNLSKGLAAKFQLFPKAMIDKHGNDLLRAVQAEENGSPASSGASTPVTAAASSTIAASSTGTKAPSTSTIAAEKPPKKGISTSKVKTSGDFMISASDLFELLTNDQKVPMWSRNKATIAPKEGAEVSLFGGNITGKMLSVSSPNSFAQTWRAPTWPEGHFGKLSASLQQGSGSTTLALELDGVPVGKEDETEKGIEIYYIRSLKQMGLVKSSSALTKPLLRTPPHPWNLPNYVHARPGRFEYLLTSAVSVGASVLLPLSLIGIFGWLLWRGPTFQG